VCVVVMRGSAHTRPRRGEGPSQAIQRSGALGMLVEARGRQGETARVRVRVNGDPGYLCTAIMAAESALCLAMDVDSPLLPRLPTDAVHGDDEEEKEMGEGGASCGMGGAGGTERARGVGVSPFASSSSRDCGDAGAIIYRVACGGLLTPSTACGRALVRRLEASGRFDFTRVALHVPGKL
jgi:hypothetical protein